MISSKVCQTMIKLIGQLAQYDSRSMMGKTDTNKQTKTQECNICKHVSKCYGPTSPRNIVLNVLSCRIRNNIDADRSAKLLLDMIRPSLINLVNNARSMVGSGYIDIEYMIRDLESRVIECLIDENGYRVGGTSYLTSYLFSTNPAMGWVRKWILWHFHKDQRFFKRHTLFGSSPQSDSDEEMSEIDRNALNAAEVDNSHEPDEETQQTVNNLMEIINDGYTLNHNEYRVMTFCLTHANESNKSRLIDGTHTYLSKAMKVSRPRVTRIFAVARNKLARTASQRNLQFCND